MKMTKTVPTKNVIRIVLITAAILAVPFIAMRFTDEVRWDLRDFIIMGGLLLSTGLTYELVAAQVDVKHRSLIAGLFIVAVLIAWIELAVGIFE